MNRAKHHRSPRKRQKNSAAAQNRGPQQKPVVTVGELRIERIVGGGNGIARDDKGVILVEGAAKDDLVLCQISKKRGVRWGRIQEVIEAGPARIEPSCPKNDVCGGCDFLHLSDEGQAEAKRSIVQDGLRRMARLSDDDTEQKVAAVFTPSKRARVRTRVRAGSDGKLGYYAKGGYDVVPLDNCPALDDKLVAALAELKMANAEIELAVGIDGEVVSAAPELFETQMATAVNEGPLKGAVLVDDEGEVTGHIGAPFIHGLVAPDVLNHALSADAHTFAQATFGGARAISNAVVDAAFAKAPAAPSAALLEGAFDPSLYEARDLRVLDLFAGAGHLTFALAACGAEVIAIEGEGHGLHWLHENADIAAKHDLIASTAQLYIDGKKPATFQKLLRQIDLSEDEVDVLVVDPPRTGIPHFGGLLDVCAPKRLVMVSCDPATGSRDLKAAVDAGYDLEWVQPIDAFPGTHHVEWVACLTGKTEEAE
ncbi:MAG: class I SAM-dependent RNA methyltransferase [Deltaproteobacteria bacterium]|nr:class I SAM-dependent RNA methyltransferase [Deltaproteobacteria bacterium]